MSIDIKIGKLYRCKRDYTKYCHAGTIVMPFWLEKRGFPLPEVNTVQEFCWVKYLCEENVDECNTSAEQWYEDFVEVD